VPVNQVLPQQLLHALCKERAAFVMEEPPGGFSGGTFLAGLRAAGAVRRVACSAYDSAVLSVI
jgi:hypothetical protein